MVIYAYLAKLTTKVLISLSLGLILSIGIIDYLIRLDIGLSIFYLIPITIVTWFVNQKVGIIYSIMSGVSWLIGDLHAKIYPYAWMPYWNTSVRFGFFIITVTLLANLKYAYEY